MKNYVIVGIYCSLNSGKVWLTNHQFGLRKYQTEEKKKTKNGVYTIIKKMNFKRGEIIGYDGEVNKLKMTEMFPLDSLKKRIKNIDIEKMDREQLELLMNTNHVSFNKHWTNDMMLKAAIKYCGIDEKTEISNTIANAEGDNLIKMAKDSGIEIKKNEKPDSIKSKLKKHHLKNIR